MAVQYKDKSWGGVKSFAEAAAEFNIAAESGLARKLIVGTEAEVEEMIEEGDTADKLAALTTRLDKLEAKSDSSIVIPTAAELDEFKRLSHG